MRANPPVELVFDRCLLKPLLPGREKSDLDHPDRVKEINFAGNRYCGAGLTTTTHAQITVTLASI